MKWLVIIPFASILLAGCMATTPEKPKTVEERFGPKCEEYGFTPGTDKYSECLMALDQHNKDVIRALLIESSGY